MATKKKAKKRASNPKRKRAKRAANPPKKRAKRRASNPAPKKRAKRRASNPKRKRAKRASNPSRATKRPRRRNARRRRNNPGWTNLEGAAMALLAGAGAAVAASFINDGPLGNRGPNVQNIVLAGEVLAAVYYIQNPMLLGGVVVGLTLVPVAAMIYKMVPQLAAPAAMGPPPPLPPGTTVVMTPPPATMSALHKGNIARMRGLDRRMAALHAGRGMGALHRGNIAALHNGTIGTMHVSGADVRAARMASMSRRR